MDSNSKSAPGHNNTMKTRFLIRTDQGQLHSRTDNTGESAQQFLWKGLFQDLKHVCLLECDWSRRLPFE
ncbi:hypothetical protein XELAEV_18003599mg [Xenopus laevis]|nr:hypothetical protein XELAEV_18003599mg [Xenopus laevis]